MALDEVAAREPQVKAKTKGKPRSQVAIRSKAAKQDDSIMGTNNSSIMSKRSVEFLYYPNEPHFFRYFTKKQRRAPLINRGYWLRMKAVDSAVHSFLKQSPGVPKAVINLGCGYDPLPWQCLTRYPQDCSGVKFIDIDYVDLMRRKTSVVKDTPQLNSLLTDLQILPDVNYPLRSEEYVQIGCDLRDLTKLSMLLADIVDLGTTQLFFTAEVSITYMDQKSADALIQWAATLPNASFCLLEQILPAGDHHPFAQTMLAHFDRLQTTLGSVKKYPSVPAQENRFRGLGWAEVNAKDLWDLWSSSDFLTPAERQSLDDIEPFDEWEEFSIFARHYFLLVAQNKSVPDQIHAIQTLKAETPNVLFKTQAGFSPYPRGSGQRRFAASMEIKGIHKQHMVIANFGGMGSASRESSLDLYRTSDSQEAFFPAMSSLSPATRMCHTITPVGGAGCLLVGGRSSPDKARADCWFYHKWTNTWEKVDDLPEPLYRHSAVAVDEDTVLITGGKTHSTKVSSAWYSWSRAAGWKECHVESTNGQVPVVFGAAMASIDGHSGVLTGGLSPDGVIQQSYWEWKVNTSAEKLSIYVQETQFSQSAKNLARFGAAIVSLKGLLLLVGGIAKHSLLQAHEEILSLEITPDKKLQVSNSVSFELSPRPLLVGMSLVSDGESVLLAGGGAVCFSFGTFWNKGCYTLHFPMNESSEERTTGGRSTTKTTAWNDWAYFRTLGTQPSSKFLPTKASNGLDGPRIIQIPRAHIDSSNDFDSIVLAAKPVVLQGQKIGSCTEKWTKDYLKRQVGSERKITAHASHTSRMDFNIKNFEYQTMEFGRFLDEAADGKKLYLRALSTEKPSELPASLESDYPSISGDFELPPELKTVKDNMHSSPLRISGLVNMWLHYDVMANVYCQIRGSKRFRLISPVDAQHIHLNPGTSSSSLDVFDESTTSRLAGITLHETTLAPGELLFLPSLWLHSAAPTDGMSVAVNIFFRNLKTGYAAGKDVYGNRDIQAYEKGRQEISKISKSFAALPFEMRHFYVHRLARELAASVDGAD